MELTRVDVDRVCHHFNLGDPADYRAVISLNAAGGTGRVAAAINSIRRALTLARAAAMVVDDKVFIDALRKARTAINVVLGEE